MISEPSLPVDVRELFSGRRVHGRTLLVPLPPGRTVVSDEGRGDRHVLWLSDGPATAELWGQFYGEHAGSGLWPLLLDSSDPGDEEFRPWGSGELFPGLMSSPEIYDPADILATWWHQYTASGGDEGVPSSDEQLADVAPFGRSWPGLAPGCLCATDPGETAARYAARFTARQGRARLGLVAADSGAASLAAAGWSGPVNYDNDTGKYAAVVGDWERRFGVRVVAVGFSTLHLSVAAPPTRREDALLVAAEHFSFCPDNIWQGTHPFTLAAYAESLIDADSWDFWWD